jgi:hypothetical protein
MNPLSLFYFQIGIDALMCGLILYFLWRVGKKTAEPVVGGEQARQELQRLIAESQKSAEQFLDALAEGRKALKGIPSSDSLPAGGSTDGGCRAGGEGR